MAGYPFELVTLQCKLNYVNMVIPDSNWLSINMAWDNSRGLWNNDLCLTESYRRGFGLESELRLEITADRVVLTKLLLQDF